MDGEMEVCVAWLKRHQEKHDALLDKEKMGYDNNKLKNIFINNNEPNIIQANIFFNTKKQLPWLTAISYLKNMFRQLLHMMQYTSFIIVH